MPTGSEMVPCFLGAHNINCVNLVLVCSKPIGSIVAHRLCIRELWTWTLLVRGTLGLALRPAAKCSVAQWMRVGCMYVFLILLPDIPPSLNMLRIYRQTNRTNQKNLLFFYGAIINMSEGAICQKY